MKCLQIYYSDSFDEEVTQYVEKCGVTKLSRIRDVQGWVTGGEPRLGDDVWPGLNYLLIVFADDGVIGRVVDGLADFKRSNEGILLKAFILPAEEVNA